MEIMNYLIILIKEILEQGEKFKLSKKTRTENFFLLK
jgi:hypothetical protein